MSQTSRSLARLGWCLPPCERVEFASFTGAFLPGNQNQNQNKDNSLRRRRRASISLEPWNTDPRPRASEAGWRSEDCVCVFVSRSSSSRAQSMNAGASIEVRAGVQDVWHGGITGEPIQPRNGGVPSYPRGSGSNAAVCCL